MSEVGKVQITVPFDATELWSRVCGAAWETWPWWLGWRYEGGDWNVPCTLEILCWHPDEEDSEPEDYVSAFITVDDLARAISELAAGGGHRVAADFINDNLDASTSDVIMQHAVYGQTIYG